MPARVSRRLSRSVPLIGRIDDRVIMEWIEFEMTSRNEQDEDRRPLAGIRILELTHYAVGPYAGYLLGLLGADVVKIEHPGGGDPLRGWGSGSPEKPGEPSLFFRACNSGKSSVALDVYGPGGADAVRSLLGRFDIFITNLTNDSLARLGLTGKQCLEVNPELVYVSVTGFGNKGPLASRPAFDTIAQAVTGLLDVYLSVGAVPDNAPPIADLTGGLTAAAGALAGLVSRLRTGRGSLIETSLLESMATILTGSQINTNMADARSHKRSANSQMYQVLASDGRYVAIHLSTSEKYWRRFVEALDLAELSDDPRFSTYRLRAQHYAEIHAILSVHFARKSSTDWETVLAGAGVPFAKVFTVSESMTHPQSVALDVFDYDEQGKPTLFRGPWQFDGERPLAGDHVPALGEGSVSVLSEVLTESEIAGLIASGVVSHPADQAE